MTFDDEAQSTLEIVGNAAVIAVFVVILAMATMRLLLRYGQRRVTELI